MNRYRTLSLVGGAVLGSVLIIGVALAGRYYHHRAAAAVVMVSTYLAAQAYVCAWMWRSFNSSR